MVDYVYDIESYRDCFVLVAEQLDTDNRWVFQKNKYKDDSVEIVEFLLCLKNNNDRMIGYNNLHFDYQIIHTFIDLGGSMTSEGVHNLGERIFQNRTREIPVSEHHIKQIDLFKIHHFDKDAKYSSLAGESRSTRLKDIEFNLRAKDIIDLPYPVKSELNEMKIQQLIDYCIHDVKYTKALAIYSKPEIDLREQLSEKYGTCMLNHNDVRIGVDIFCRHLDQAGVSLLDELGRKRQTPRPTVDMSQVVFPWIEFEEPVFQQLKAWYQGKNLSTFKGLSQGVQIGNLTLQIGSGGIHGSVKDAIAVSNDTHMVVDVDVAGYYPELVVKNQYYPEHLGESFCDVMRELKEKRATFAKGTAENTALKLAANATVGHSNNKFSHLYDPQFFLTTTVNGQLLLCLLIEKLKKVPELTFIQANTDGLTLRIKREYYQWAMDICKHWENLTHLTLEYQTYSAMYIKNVNSYLAVDESGTVCKRKGMYAHVFNPDRINAGQGDLEWHKNHSALVIPKVAEAILTTPGTPRTSEAIADVLHRESNLFDFCIKAKVSGDGRLYLEGDEGAELELGDRLVRYYISTKGNQLFKKMSGKRINIDKGYLSTVCNEIEHAIEPINYDYYQRGIEALVLPLQVVNS